MSGDKNKKDYSNGKIYCIRNNINDDIYAGSTCQSLSQRMALHRYDSIKANRQNTKLYRAMIEHGREHFYIELIEDYPCENVYQLQRREGEIIRKQKPNLNIVVARRSKEEYKEDEKENIKMRKALHDQRYYNLNKGTILEKKQKYREEHADKIREMKQTHYIANAEKIKERQGQQIVCECGCIYTHGHRQRHFRTQKHQNYLKSMD